MIQLVAEIESRLLADEIALLWQKSWIQMGLHDGHSGPLGLGGWFDRKVQRAAECSAGEWATAMGSAINLYKLRNSDHKLKNKDFKVNHPFMKPQRVTQTHGLEVMRTLMSHSLQNKWLNCLLKWTVLCIHILLCFLLMRWLSCILYLTVIQKFVHRVVVGWSMVAVCCAKSDSLIPELVHESVLPFHLLSRPQPSCLVSAWLWWTHAPPVPGRTVFFRNLNKNGNCGIWVDTHRRPQTKQKQKESSHLLLF